MGLGIAIEYKKWAGETKKGPSAFSFLGPKAHEQGGSQTLASQPTPQKREKEEGLEVRPSFNDGRGRR